MSSSTDRIEKQVVLDAPRSRVWRAITDVRQFNQWFGVALKEPFAQGGTSSGNVTHPGYESLVMTLWVETVEPETRFAFRWHPDARDMSADYSKEPTTLVTFLLEDAGAQTKLTITETGFDALPESRRATAFKGNDAGWAQQAVRIGKFLATQR